MKLKPLLTEKSMKQAEGGQYSFWIPKGLKKHEIKKLISETFEVNVKTIKTISIRATTKKNFAGKLQNKKARKKAIVRLAEGQSIEAFGEKKKKKTKKK